MLYGIDVSSYQGKIDWTKVAAAGKRFAIVKCSEGDHVLDPDRLIDLSGAKAVGLYTGVYHYAHEELGDGATQCQKLWDAMGDTMPDLPPMLDFESMKDTPAKAFKFVRDFKQQCLDTFGRPPMLYTYPAFWRGLGADAIGASDLLDCPLAIAQYPRLDAWTPGPNDRPALIAPWNAWTFWQYSGSGVIAGIAGHVDLDVFNGDEAALRDLCGFPPLPSVS